jgi:hypothetical protein
MRSGILAFALTCAVAFLAGCAEDTAARQANDAAIAAADDAVCRTYGAPESKAYAQCRANKSLLHDRMSPSPGTN